VHYDTVLRVLLQAGLSRNGSLIRRSQIEPYLPFISETLAQQLSGNRPRAHETCGAQQALSRPNENSDASGFTTAVSE
jgi:hypothetical protein